MGVYVYFLLTAGEMKSPDGRLDRQGHASISGAHQDCLSQ